jgi:hypothetical protein
MDTVTVLVLIGVAYYIFKPAPKKEEKKDDKKGDKKK